MLSAKTIQAPAIAALSVLGNIDVASSTTADISPNNHAGQPLPTRADQRRADRPHIDSLHLVRLLRAPAASSEPDCLGDLSDGLDTAAGTIFGLVISVPIWALTALPVYGLIHVINALF